MKKFKTKYYVKLVTKKGATITLDMECSDQYEAVHETIESLSNDITFDGIISVYEKFVPVTKIEMHMVKVYESKLKF